MQNLNTKTEVELSIVIPAFNEEKRITFLLDDLVRYFKDSPILYEVIIVDDGSSDNLAGVINNYTFSLKNLRLIRNGLNKGKGFSVKRGMLEACGQKRLFLDADNSVTIENLPRFIQALNEGADIVIGSIELPGSSKKDHNQWFRRILGVLAKKLIRFVATPGIYDTQRGFKLFRAETAEQIFNKVTIERWGFDIEVLTIAQLYRLRVTELPVIWDNPETKSINLAAYEKTLRELWQIKRNIWKGKYGGPTSV